MEFKDAVRSFYKRYTDFEGRSSRSEYWWPVLFIWGAIFVLVLVIGAFASIPGIGEILAGIGALAYIIFALANLIPMISVMVRRLHDQNQSGWLALLMFVDVVSIIQQ